MKKHLAIILILISFKSFACSCAIKKLSDWQKFELENSECIFIGEVLNIDAENNTFEIKVIESFNGDEKGKVYNGIYDSMCGPIIDEKGEWLIYANYNSESQIEVNTCGITRSLKNPDKNISATILPPPSYPNEKKSITEKKIAEWKLRAKTDLESEIANLREKTK